MRTVLKLIVLAAIVAAVFQYGLPFLQRHSGGGTASSLPPEDGESGAWDCVEAASTANADFTAATRSAARAIGEASGYPTVVRDARASIEDARARCNCQHVACGKASRALDALDELVDVYDDMLGGTGMANPAAARERVETLLAEARQAADIR